MTTSLSNTLPIAEIFTSIHGEGYWAGTPMTFIRLAGCTVGKLFQNNGSAPIDFPRFSDGKYNFVCTTFDGRHFPCDTDYRKTGVETIEQLVDQIPSYIKHVCITGGEPLMHREKLIPLVFAILAKDIMVHFESSGTISPPKELSTLPDIWWVCSPKAGYLPGFLHYIADEVRIMVDKELKISDVQSLLVNVTSQTRVYFCPLSSQSSVTEFDPESMEAAMKFLELFPGSRISIQMHKILGVR